MRRHTSKESLKGEFPKEQGQANAKTLRQMRLVASQAREKVCEAQERGELEERDHGAGG